ncbi:hypothetical protein [Syntrophorhabdus aromaticivorans]|nr:hypothetical protein [Syntrophorhabdus aromaticivorans]
MFVLAIAIDRAMAFTPWLLRRGRARLARRARKARLAGRAR